MNSSILATLAKEARQIVEESVAAAAPKREQDPRHPNCDERPRKCEQRRHVQGDLARINAAPSTEQFPHDYGRAQQ